MILKLSSQDPIIMMYAIFLTIRPHYSSTSSSHIIPALVDMEANRIARSRSMVTVRLARLAACLESSRANALLQPYKISVNRIDFIVLGSGRYIIQDLCFNS